MVTLFTTPKPFAGHNAMIQRNALKSWTRLHPDVEVIVFGDDEGAAETCAELGIRHVPRVERVPEGPKILRSFFDAAQKIARHDVLCYANCDIILTQDFVEAISMVRAARRNFLMVGRRCDTNIERPIDFGREDWAEILRKTARETGEMRSGDWIDFFAFPRGLYLDKMPGFVIGRVFWDQWLVWKARSSGAAVVDASEAVLAVHQNHDYGYHAAGRQGVWGDELSMRNLELAGGRWHLCTIEDATHLMNSTGIRENPARSVRALRRAARIARETLWLKALAITRPIRRAIGLQKSPQKPAVSASSSATDHTNARN